jgi:hypothetical protein
MWVSAWWTGQEDYQLQVSKEGIKFTPRGAGVARAAWGKEVLLEGRVPLCHSASIKIGLLDTTDVSATLGRPQPALGTLGGGLAYLAGS